MKFKHIDLHPTNPIFKEQFTVELRPKGKRPIDVTQLLDEGVEAWVADTFGYLGVSFGPDGQICNS